MSKGDNFKGKQKLSTKTKDKRNNGDTSTLDKSRNKNGFIIISSNGSKMISNILLNLNFTKISNISDTDYYLKWTDVHSQIDWESFSEFKQMINHIPNTHSITNKGNLLHNLRQFDRLSKSTSSFSGSLEMDSFFPETYYINNSKELQTFYDNIHKCDMWIYKPTDLNQGIGISLIRDKQSLDSILSKDLNSPNMSRRPTGRIIQRYIMNPLLVNNKKFDIRVYMLIANTTPFLVLYHPGYLRLSLEDYANDSDKLLIHLTNQYVQKKDPSYEDVKDDTVWSMEQFGRYLNANLKSYPQISKNWVRNILTNRIKSIMRQVFLSVKHKLSQRVGLFELFGLDFMIDSDFKIWMIEVNVNPALDTNCAVLKEKLPVLVESTFNVVTECFEKCKQKSNLLPLQNMGKFEIVYSDDSKWNWPKYLGSTKLTASLMKIYKTPSQNSSVQNSDQKDSDNSRKLGRSQSNLVNKIQRNSILSPTDARKFPFSTTEKLYRESFQMNNNANMKWIKIQ